MSANQRMIFRQGCYPMTFYLLPDSTMIKLLIEGFGGEVIQSPKFAQHLIIEDEEQNNLPLLPLGWQLVLSPEWVLECCKQAKLVDPVKYFIKIVTTESSATALALSRSSVATALQRPTPAPIESATGTCTSTPITLILPEDQDHMVIARVESLDTSGSTSNKRNSENHELHAGTSNKRTKVDDTSSVQKGEMIYYGHLKEWIKDRRHYDIRSLHEPEKTYRKKELFNILVIELAIWSNLKGKIYKGEVRRFCMNDLRKRRPWRDWLADWQTQKLKIMKRLNKLHIDTSTWCLKKKNRPDLEIISISSDGEGEEANTEEEGQWEGEGEEEGEEAIKEEIEEDQADLNDELQQDRNAVTSNRDGDSLTHHDNSLIDAGVAGPLMQVKVEDN